MLQRIEAMFNRIKTSAFLQKANKFDVFQTDVSHFGHRLSGKKKQKQIRTKDTKYLIDQHFLAM